ncbi:hypothetical protein ABET51_13425 [Metabacillus fastidiosus]
MSKNPQEEKSIDKLEVHSLKRFYRSYQYLDGNNLPWLEVPIKNMDAEF